MAEQIEPMQPSRDENDHRALAVQMLTTEHFTLQGARAAATAESSSRSALFLTVVSAALVAVALAAQVTNPKNVLLLALIALGVVFFLGLVTYLRVLENGIEDFILVRAINRIRHFYVEVAPETAEYFVLSTHDDAKSIHRSMGMTVRSWECLLTSAGAVGVVNAVVGGVIVSITLQLLVHPTLAITTLVGAASAIAITIGFLRHHGTRWRRANLTFPARFPRSPIEAAGKGSERPIRSSSQGVGR